MLHNKFKNLWIILLTAISSTGCGYTVDPETEFPLQMDRLLFDQKQGYRHSYNLYFPNSLTGWIPNSDNQLMYDEKTSTYSIHNINIGREPIDDLGYRFKVTSQYWEYQFGFMPIGSSIELSSFGIKPEGTIIQIKRFPDTTDIYFEVPQDSNANYLHVSVKFTAKSHGQTALLLAEYSQAPIDIP